MTKFFFFGSVRPDPEGHKRITVSENMKVVGGTQEEHEQAVEIIQKFGEVVSREGPEDAERILRETIRKVKGE